MRIYLIGFMNSGKSTLGKETASFFNVPFMDTDLQIEAIEGRSVQTIFSDAGEHYFRDLESDVLRETIEMTKGIIATGGGLPCFHQNMDWILQNGISIYLQWSLAQLKENLLLQRSGRPLLSNMTVIEAAQTIDELFEMRVPFYEKAAITIEMTGDKEKDLKALIKTCGYIW